MKKFVIIILLVSVMIFSAACSPAANNSASQGNNTATVPVNNTDPAPIEPSGTTDPVKTDPHLQELYETGIHTSDDLALFLNGTWSMLPEGSQIGETQEYGDLSFDMSTKTASWLLKFGGAAKAEFSFTTGKLFENTNVSSEDTIRFTIKSADGIMADGKYDITGDVSDYQVFFCRYKDDDIMILRQLGNGYSAMSIDILGADFNQTSDGCFIFYRQGGTLSEKVLDDKFYADTRYYAVTFMALRWVDLEGSCWLMPVRFEYFTEALFAEPMDLIRIGYAPNNAMYCIKYEMQDGTKEIASAPFDPQLVEVTVEGDQKITEIYKHPYLIYGVYSHDMEIPGQGGGSDYRDPNIYGTTDSWYLGEWVDETDSNRKVTISVASPQTGGYKIDFHFYGDTGEGYANIAEDDALFINQGFFNGNIRYEGVLQKTEKGISLLATSSSYKGAPTGSVFNLVKDVEGPSGGGSEYRDPAKYGYYDSYFIKTWYDKEDTERTLVISKESLQTGGYRINVDLPDGTKAECYASLEDGDLVINQGFIEGKYRIGGYLRQSDEISLRLEITASDYEGLKTGRVFFYSTKK